MDYAEIAKKIRVRIFEQASEDGRVMHSESMDRVIAEVLRAVMPIPQPHGYGAYGYPTTMEDVATLLSGLDYGLCGRADKAGERK